MALGSSAPEILLSVIETLQTLGEPAGDLGPSTIVGSAAFNLLVISGLSILAVDEVKSINDLGVFFTTSVFSLFAYIWLYLCLQDNRLTVGEAWWTLIFFIILISLAYIADKFNQHFESLKDTQDEIERKNKEDEMKIKKSQLRQLAKQNGEQAVLLIAQGI